MKGAITQAIYKLYTFYVFIFCGGGGYNMAEECSKLSFNKLFIIIFIYFL
jgi:hypothetical protein